MKKLYRSRKDKLIAGVCGGLAEYFATDPVLVRVIFILLAFPLHGLAFLGYIIAWIIIPKKPLELEQPVAQSQSVDPCCPPAANEEPIPASDAPSTSALFIGALLIMLGIVFLMGNIPIFHHFWHWFWSHAFRFIWPSILVVIGIFIVLRGTKNK